MKEENEEKRDSAEVRKSYYEEQIKKEIEYMYNAIERMDREDAISYAIADLIYTVRGFLEIPNKTTAYAVKEAIGIARKVGLSHEEIDTLISGAIKEYIRGS